MPLDSPYYISRAADDEFRQAIARRASIVLVKGPRQVGKSSLLARALEDARRAHASVVFTDVQALGRDDLRSPIAVYQALGRSIAEQIKVSSSILDRWNDSDSPNTNFSRYVSAILRSHTRRLGAGRSRSAGRPGFLRRRVRVVPVVAQPARARSGGAVGPADARDRICD